VEFHLFHFFRNVFDKYITVLTYICNFFFKPESSALLATDFKIANFFAHLYVILKLSAGYFHETFEKLLFDVSEYDGNVIENNTSLFFHDSGEPVTRVLNFRQIVKVYSVNLGLFH